MMTAALTRQKASRVPMLTNFAISSIGKQLAVRATQPPTMMVDIYGVPKRGWTAAKSRSERRPSLAIAHSILDWLMSKTGAHW